MKYVYRSLSNDELAKLADDGDTRAAMQLSTRELIGADEHEAAVEDAAEEAADGERLSLGQYSAALEAAINDELTDDNRAQLRELRAEIGDDDLGP